MKDYYQILGINKGASTDEIKKAYHKLAHKHHPDKGGDEKKFKEISEAYQILSNKEKRSQYDQFGRVFEQGGFEHPGFDFGFGKGGAFDFDSGDVGDLGEMVEEMFGFSARGGPASGWGKKDLKKGKDIEIDLEIPLEATLRGLDREIALYKFIACSRCQGVGAEPGSQIKECFSCRGTGQVQQIKRTFFGSFTRVSICPECGGEGYVPEKPCNVCRGEGRVKGEEKIKISIPAGVDSNQAIKIVDRGDAGRKKGKAGNLYVRILVQKHQLFKRRGDDLYMRLPVSISQAVLGDEIEIPTLDGGEILLKVPQGTESGKILRISGKGIPHFSGYGRGHLYVELEVKTPKKLNKRQKELLEKLKEEGI